MPIPHAELRLDRGTAEQKVVGPIASDACISLCCVGLPLEAARTSSVVEGVRDAHSPIDVKQDALYKYYITLV